MSRHTPFSDLHLTISRYFVGSFSALTKAFTGLTLPRGGRSGEPDAPPTSGQESNNAGIVVDTPPAAEESALTRRAPKAAKVKPAAETTRSSSPPIAEPPVEEALETVAAPAPAPRPKRASKRTTSPVPFADPELEAMRARVASLETRVIDLEAYKAEMEQLLDEYAFRQYLALGDLVGEHLRLQHEVLQRAAERRSSTASDKAAAEAAAEEYEAYQRAREAPVAPPAELGEDERKELTALYRAAAMRCHPDRVGEAEKERAHEMFLRTQEAYRRRDLDALRLIGQQLGAVDLAASALDASTPHARLEALLESLKDKGAALLMAIQSIQMQAQYRKARYREHWDDHFAEARLSLERECAALRRQLAFS